MEEFQEIHEMWVVADNKPHLFVEDLVLQTRTYIAPDGTLAAAMFTDRDLVATEIERMDDKDVKAFRIASDRDYLTILYGLREAGYSGIAFDAYFVGDKYGATFAGIADEIGRIERRMGLDDHRP